MSEREPFSVASDLEPQAISGESEYEPTIRDVSVQVAAMSGHLNVLHREVALSRAELKTLSEFVMADQAPRITALEKASPMKMAKALGRYSGVVGIVLGLLELLSSLKPGLAGPISELIKLVSQ